MEKGSDFLESWLGTQQQAMDAWLATTNNMQQTFLNHFGAQSGSAKDPGKEITDLYSSWVNSVWGSFTKSESLDTVKEAASKLISSSNVYMKLYEVWLPLLRAIQEKAFAADTYKDLIDPSKYKEVLDQLFGLSSGGAKDLYERATKFLQTWGSTKGYLTPWTEAMDNSLKALPELVEGRPESIIGVFHDMFTAFDKTYGKAFHIPAVGKDREKVELLLRLSDSLGVYLSKNTKYQYLMYLTGMLAMDKVIEAITGKIKSGEEIKNFDEFFDVWLQVTEKRYLELFETDEFAKLQGEVFDASLDVRKYMFKLMELYLYDSPIPLRSEMDDLYKTIYDLKKQMRNLERQVRKLSPQEVMA